MSNSHSSDSDNVINVTELVSLMKRFGIIDYGFFIAMLVLSSAIGLYFGVQDKKKNRQPNRRRESIELDYFVGGRKMSPFPIGVSLAATLFSGISILGLTTEMYVYGTEFVFYLITFVVGAICVHYLFIPVYLELKLTSSYEYLEARFDRKMRYMGAFIFILTNMFSMPIVLYATALAFNQVSGINIHVITVITCLVCIFYTTLGGMKAVVWTDVVQTIIMSVILILILIKGTLEIGGLNTIWQRNYESGRIEFPALTLDPTVRHSFLAILIGGSFHISNAISINQIYIQRYISLPGINASRKALWIFTISVIILFSLCYYIGLLIYATYHDCDPVTTGLAQSKDQLLPVFVMDILKNLPGIAGLFVSGIFSASLSTLSTTLNSLSAVILEDFVKTLTNKQLTGFIKNIIMRGVVLISGLICVGLVFIVESFGTVLQLKITVTSCTSGPLFGIFLIGLLLPWINSNSALFGGVFSLIVMAWITIKGQMAIRRKEIVFDQKPTSIHGCTYNFTSVVTESIIREDLDPATTQIYHVSYLWYVLIGALMTIIVAGFASFLFGRQNPRNVNAVLLAPFIRKYFRTKDRMMVKIEKCEMNEKGSMMETPHESSQT